MNLSFGRKKNIMMVLKFTSCRGNKFVWSSSRSKDLSNKQMIL